MNPTSLILLLGGVIFILAGGIQYKFPPKNINALYGYRTGRSMRNPEVWKFAQSHSAIKLMQVGGWICALGLLAWAVDFQPNWGIWLALGIVTAFPLLMLLQVECDLKKRFPDNQ